MDKEDRHIPVRTSNIKIENSVLIHSRNYPDCGAAAKYVY